MPIESKGKLTGQKPPLKLKEIWAIRIRLHLAKEVRDLAMFNLAIDSKLRGCDLVALKVRDVTHGNQVAPRTIVMQHKTQRPVQFEMTEPTRDALAMDCQSPVENGSVSAGKPGTDHGIIEILTVIPANFLAYGS